MAPKNRSAAPPRSALELEAEVLLPKEMDESLIPEVLPLRIALAHVVGHRFTVEEPLPQAHEVSEIGEVLDPASAPALVEFDPVAVLSQYIQDPAVDALSKRALFVDREELALLGEGGSLSKGLGEKLRKERHIWERAKTNAARRRAIAHFEDKDYHDPHPSWMVEENCVDLVLMLQDYPATADELQELGTAGVCELADLWLLVCFAGCTITEECGEDGAAASEEGHEAAQSHRRSEMCALPQIALEFRAAIEAAAFGTTLAQSTMCTVQESQTLVRCGDAQLDVLFRMFHNVIGDEMVKRAKYMAWLSQLSPAPVPDLDPSVALDLRRYDMLMSSVGPAQHDVPLFIHCLTEQVVATLTGDDLANRSDAGSEGLDQFLDELALSSGLALGTGTTDKNVETSCPELLSSRDELARRHFGHKLPGEISSQAVAKRIMECLQGPGLRRDGLPENLESEARRSAEQNKMYPFFPHMSERQVERCLLHHEIEQLLSAAQPERRWNVQESTFHECIPKELFAQTLLAVTCEERFFTKKYIPRHDSCLLACYHRALPGRVLWHCWRGDLHSFLEAEDGVEEQRLSTLPSYSDWAHLFGAAHVAVPKQCLDLDARKLGYNTILEKTMFPPDGSIIFSMRMQRGLAQNFTVLSAESVVDQYLARKDAVVEPIEEGDSRDSPVQSRGSEQDSHSVHPPQILTQETNPATVLQDRQPTEVDNARFDTHPHHEERLAWMAKGDFIFGMATDTTWAERCAGLRVEHDELVARERESLAAAQAARTDELPEGEAQQSFNEASARGETHFPVRDYGILWLSFKDGARASVRMHHEKAFPNGVQGCSEEKDLGVVVTYTLTSGQVIQVLSDGCVVQHWPVSPGCATSTGSARWQHLALGCAEDDEVWRVIAPSGALIRRHVSGFTLVCHPDGTVAQRNPTVAEARAAVDMQRALPDGGAQTGLLENFLKKCEEHQGESVESLCEVAKSVGLPGHWRVQCVDGKVIGRSDAPASSAHVGDAAPAEDGRPGEDDVASLRLGISHTSEMQVHELLGSVLVDAGNTLEYEMERATVTRLIDPHTSESVALNPSGVTVVENTVEGRRHCVHGDGTHVVCHQDGSKYTVEIDKVGNARVTCSTTAGEESSKISLRVECADGTSLVVCGSVGTSHAAVTLRHASGVLLHSYGTGFVDVAKEHEPLSRSEGGDTLDTRGIYVASCDQNRVHFRDNEGNIFEQHGDQSVLCRSGTQNETLDTPRGMESGRPYPRADASIQFVPEAAAPRVFLIDGNGDAEELLASPVARDALHDAASGGDECVVQQLVDHPVPGCTTHTIYRERDTRSHTLPLRNVNLPPSAMGCLSLPTDLLALRDHRFSYTEMREIVEYPVISDSVQQTFLAGLVEYQSWKEREDVAITHKD